MTKQKNSTDKKSVYRSNSLRGWLLFISFILSLGLVFRLFVLIKEMFKEEEINFWVIIALNLLLLTIVLSLYYCSKATTVVLTDKGILGKNFLRRKFIFWEEIIKVENKESTLGRIIIVKSHQGGSGLLGNIVFDSSIPDWQELEGEIKDRIKKSIKKRILVNSL